MVHGCALKALTFGGGIFLLLIKLNRFVGDGESEEVLVCFSVVGESKLSGDSFKMSGAKEAFLQGVSGLRSGTLHDPLEDSRGIKCLRIK